MSEHGAQATEGAVEFNAGEADALRDIVTDWVNEQLLFPPFPAEVTSIIEKLDITASIDVPDQISSPRNLNEL